jgi:hypothetical protein
MKADLDGTTLTDSPDTYFAEPRNTQVNVRPTRTFQDELASSRDLIFTIY